MDFKGRSERFSISLPEDMVEYYRLKAKRDDRPLSTVIKRALERDIMAQPARLVDTRESYVVDALQKQEYARDLEDMGAPHTTGGDDE